MTTSPAPLFRATASAMALALAIACSPGPAAAQDAAARAKVVAFLKQDPGVAGGSRNGVKIELVDLNGDGAPEALATVTDQTLCGTGGCGYVLDLRGAAAKEIGSYVSDEITALTTRTNGWRDVAIGKRKVTFRNGRYGS